MDSATCNLHLEVFGKVGCEMVPRGMQRFLTGRKAHSLDMGEDMGWGWGWVYVKES